MTMTTTPTQPPVKAAAAHAKRAARDEIKRGVKHLEKSIGEIQKGLRKAEREIEADARARIRTLRTDARAQLAAVKGRHREVMRSLEQVSAAAEGSWQQVKESADVILADGARVVAAILERLNKALPR
jgi:hypothetical protein